MSQYFENATRPFTASGALSAYRRVSLDGSGELEYAGATDTDWIGVLDTNALAADEGVPVRLKTAQGTCKMSAAGAITKGAFVYAAANGQIASTGSVGVGIALEATTDGANDLIEVLMMDLPIARALIDQEDAVEYPIPITDFYTWDDLSANLPGTAANDDLAVIEGTWGTDAPKVQSADAGGTTVTAYARFQFALPAEYVAAETVTLRVNAGMQVVSDTTATLDAQVYEQGAPTTDLCATAAQSINSATAANKDFTITATGLAAGDLLDARLAVAITDSGNAADYILAQINKVSMLLDVKG